LRHDIEISHYCVSGETQDADSPFKGKKNYFQLQL